DPGGEFGDTWASSVGLVTGIGGGCEVGPPGGFSQGHLILHDGIGAGWLVGPDVGRFGETARSRVSRLASTEEGFPITLTSGGDNRSMPMGPQRALPLPDLLEECAETDRGGILCE